MHVNEIHAYDYLCVHLCFIDACVCFGEHLRASMHVGDCVFVCDSNKCGGREVAEESDGSSVCCRLSLRGGTQLHPTREGQLRVIGSLVLG